MSLYVAATVTALDGIVTVDDDKLMLPTYAVSPVHLSNILPDGAADAEIVATAPAR